MMDMGLPAGARSLWEDGLLCDYTITVEDRQFRVHKVVLASVSQYFRAMFTGAMRESQTDRVELKELSADTFSKLLDLIYTGDEDIVCQNAVELFPCAVYLEIPTAIKACKQKMLNCYNKSNCLDVLSLFLTYGNPCDAGYVKEFVQQNWKEIWGKCKKNNLTYATVRVVTEVWGESEWELFQLVKDWIELDSENRRTSTNDLMQRVRFCLMTPQELAAVRETAVYQNSADSWRELVDKAAAYHTLPVHKKVVDDSKQTTVRMGAEPVFFTENDNKEGSKTCAALINGEERVWETQNIEGPTFSSAIGGTVCVNNFLICYTELDKGQTDWYIFDARTLKWSEMASMSRPKADFALVHHAKSLYVLGGRTVTQGLTKTVEQYNFRTNKWKSARIRLPVATTGLNACVLGDDIYCCSGNVQKKGLCIRSKRMVRLDMLTHKWESRAPMLVAEDDRSVMCVMTMSGEDVVVLARKEGVHTYTPSTNQWSVWDEATFHFTNVIWDNQSWIMAQGKTIFLCNILEVSDATNHRTYYEGWFNEVSGRVRRVCIRWTMLEQHDRSFRYVLDDVPVPQQACGKHEKMFGGLLSLPYHKLAST